MDVPGGEEALERDSSRVARMAALLKTSPREGISTTRSILVAAAVRVAN
jgi:hypothetical protein